MRRRTLLARLPTAPREARYESGNGPWLLALHQILQGFRMRLMEVVVAIPYAEHSRGAWSAPFPVSDSIVQRQLPRLIMIKTLLLIPALAACVLLTSCERKAPSDTTTPPPETTTPPATAPATPTPTPPASPAPASPSGSGTSGDTTTPPGASEPPSPANPADQPK